MRTANQFGFALALIVCIGGCHFFPEKHPFGESQDLSPLRPAQSSPDSVGMEIVWARFSVKDPVLGDAVWKDIDEAQIDPAVRSELVKNGFRAGVISGSMPSAIENVLHQGEAAPEPKQKDPDQSLSTELISDPIVRGRKCRPRRNQRTEIQASEIYATMPPLRDDDAAPGGRQYEQAQAVYALRVDPRPDRSVDLWLTPEIHYGSPRTKFVGSDEGFRMMEMQREREVFEKMRLSVKLAPGDTLVLMCLPQADRSLGHFFHTVQSSDGTQQKLVLIRLADMPPSDSFADSEK